MRYFTVYVAMCAVTTGDQEKSLSPEDSALIHYTLRALAHTLTKGDEAMSRIEPLTDAALRATGLTQREFLDYLETVTAEMQTKAFKKRTEEEGISNALTRLLIDFIPRKLILKKFNVANTSKDPANNIDEKKLLEKLINKLAVLGGHNPYFHTIDNLEPLKADKNTRCPDLWYYNNIKAYKCQTTLREDTRPWCSIDLVFKGNFIFCEESEEELKQRQNWIEAKILHEKVSRGLLDNLREEKYMNLKEMLDKAVELGSIDANATILTHKIFGYIYDQEMENSMGELRILAAGGNAMAQSALGIFQGSGLGTTQSQKEAILNLQFSAMGNNYEARMALANRYLYGLGLEKSCQNAMHHYKFVAEKIANEAKTLTPSSYISQLRILDDDRPRSDDRRELLLDEEMLEYYSYLSDKGDVASQVNLAQLLLQRGYDDDVYKAADLFQRASNSGSALGIAFLGKMYLEGVGVVANNLTAFKLFHLASEKGNAIALAGMGIMYMEGRAIQANSNVAVKYFQASADQGWTEGQLHLGIAYMRGTGVRKDTTEALKYLSLASKEPTGLLAFWYMAEIYAEEHILAKKKSKYCHKATLYYKFVAENGPWNKLFTHAWKQWKEKNTASALAIFSYLSELGYEKAQTNLATILDDYPIPDDLLSVNKHERAFLNWKRAANQNFPFARIRVGDHHWYGLGAVKDLEEAAIHYRIASEDIDARASAQALFNLGYMHHFGLGLPKDYHLSKRFYDAAAETSPEANLPSTIALIGLAMSFLQDIFSALITTDMEKIFTDYRHVWLISSLCGLLSFVCVYFEYIIGGRA